MNDLIDLLIRINPESTVKDYLIERDEFMIIRIATNLSEAEREY